MSLYIHLTGNPCISNSHTLLRLHVGYSVKTIHRVILYILQGKYLQCGGAPQKCSSIIINARSSSLYSSIKVVTLKELPGKYLLIEEAKITLTNVIYIHLVAQGGQIGSILLQIRIQKTKMH